MSNDLMEEIVEPPCAVCGFVPVLFVSPPTQTHRGQCQVMTNADCDACIEAAEKAVERSRKALALMGYKTDETRVTSSFQEPALKGDVH